MNPTPREKWEDEFSERFGFYGGRPKNETMTPNNIREFIHRVVKEAREEERSRILSIAREHSMSVYFLADGADMVKLDDLEKFTARTPQGEATE